MTIPNQAPLGVWGSKRKERSDSGPAARNLPGPAGFRLKRGILRSSITPNFDLLTFDLIQKNKPRSWGSSITPNFEGLGVSPEVRSPNEHAKSRGLD